MEVRHNQCKSESNCFLLLLPYIYNIVYNIGSDRFNSYLDPFSYRDETFVDYSVCINEFISMMPGVLLRPRHHRLYPWLAFVMQEAGRAPPTLLRRLLITDNGSCGMSHVFGWLVSVCGAWAVGIDEEEDQVLAVAVILVLQRLGPWSMCCATPVPLVSGPAEVLPHYQGIVLLVFLHNVTLPMDQFVLLEWQIGYCIHLHAVLWISPQSEVSTLRYRCVLWKFLMCHHPCVQNSTPSSSNPGQPGTSSLCMFGSGDLSEI